MDAAAAESSSPTPPSMSPGSGSPRRSEPCLVLEHQAPPRRPRLSLSSKSKSSSLLAHSDPQTAVSYNSSTATSDTAVAVSGSGNSPGSRSPQQKSSSPSAGQRHRNNTRPGKTYTEPVLVRTYSGPPPSKISQARSAAAKKKRLGLPSAWGWPWAAPARDEPRLPPLEAFTVKALLVDVHPQAQPKRESREPDGGITADLNRIAEICARSRYTLSDQYDVSIPPLPSKAWTAGPSALRRLGSVVSTLTSQPVKSRAVETPDSGAATPRPTNALAAPLLPTTTTTNEAPGNGKQPMSRRKPTYLAEAVIKGSKPQQPKKPHLRSHPPDSVSSSPAPVPLTSDHIEPATSTQHLEIRTAGSSPQHRVSTKAKTKAKPPKPTKKQCRPTATANTTPATTPAPPHLPTTTVTDVDVVPAPVHPLRRGCRSSSAELTLRQLLGSGREDGQQQKD